jgi:uncharacterized protein
MLFQRHVLPLLKELLGSSPVILLNGPRQSGKTTVMEIISKETGMNYVSFDDIRYLAAARQDPIGFLADIQKPLILDEVQRVPEILLPIKQDVDKHHIPGRYALTGSANPLLVPKLGDSLAGRMQILNLWPLSQGELVGVKENFINEVFSASFQSRASIPQNKKEIIAKFILGGYPSLQIKKTARQREFWCNGYINTILQKDVQDLARIEGLAHLPKLLQLLATRCSGLMNVAQLSRDCAIPVTTIHRYLQLLQTLFLTIQQPAWSRNLGTRLIKAPKIYLSDTAILTYLLEADEERLLSNSQMIGNVMENFIVTELHKQVSWSEKRYQLFHFRTSSGIEVDIVLENSAGKIVGVEVKSSETVRSDDFSHLRYLQNLVGNNFIRGIVAYLGDKEISFGENMIALPISRLWSS